jgi:tRNA A37 methylthiotransferase MiaB
VDADLDVIGVFGYSDEDGTEAEHLGDKLDPRVIEERTARITDLVESLTSDRAAARVGEDVVVLIDEIDDETGEPIGRAEHQGPEVDGVCILPPGSGVVGELVAGRAVSSEGVDLRVDSVTP